MEEGHKISEGAVVRCLRAGLRVHARRIVRCAHHQDLHAAARSGMARRGTRAPRRLVLYLCQF